ncbi:MAG: glycosyltransferase family 2 protein, partial [Pseudomonadota bacterium]
MRLYIHTGTYGPNLRLFQKALAKKRNKLLELGVLLPIHAGIYDHARPFMAGMRRSGWHPTKEAADFQDPATYAAFCDQALGDICVQIAQTRPKAMILTMSDLWTFCDTGEKLRRFMDHIDMFSDDVHACLHIDPPEVALHAHMVRQIKWGRREFGGAEAGLPNPESWFDAAHAAASVWSDQTGDDRAIVHCASPSYDQPAMLQLWENLLGEDAVFVRAFNAHPTSEDFHNDMRGFFALPGKIGRVELPPEADPLPSLPRLEKFLALNAELPAIEADNGNLRTPTRILRRRQRAIKGDVSGQRFEVAHVVPFLTKAPRGPWHAEPLSDGTKLTSLKAAPVDSDPLLKDIKTEVVGYYGRIRSWLRTRKLELAKLAKIKQDLGTSLSEDGQTLLNELGKDTYAKIMSGRFVPRQVNGFAANESEPPQPLAVKPVTPVPGTLIIACMKDEAPYILEWIAFHKSIGVENFLVFSNDCSDGTDRILDRLQELGHLIHHDNSVWQGKSPQQAALNRAMKMPIVKKASWLIHIDVDEFMNIKLGDGTLDEVLGAAGPEATNIAMTWRVFGHG